MTLQVQRGPYCGHVVMESCSFKRAKCGGCTKKLIQYGAMLHLRSIHGSSFVYADPTVRFRCCANGLQFRFEHEMPYASVRCSRGDDVSSLRVLLYIVINQLKMSSK